MANWKSNKTESEAKEWFNGIRNYELGIREKEIIICPSFTLLPIVKSLIHNHNLSIKIGAQDISPFDKGAYTGEVNGKQIKEFADYVLIGHSERKKYLFENQELLEKKVAMANTYNLQSIYFIQDSRTQIPHNVSIIAYEPPSSISPGPADTPENAENAAKSILQKQQNAVVLYGGNVTAANVGNFTLMPNINGVLVGRASLNVDEFLQIIQNA